MGGYHGDALGKAGRVVTIVTHRSTRGCRGEVEFQTGGWVGAKTVTIETVGKTRGHFGCGTSRRVMRRFEPGQSHRVP